MNPEYNLKTIPISHIQTYDELLSSLNSHKIISLINKNDYDTNKDSINIKFEDRMIYIYNNIISSIKTQDEIKFILLVVDKNNV